MKKYDLNKYSRIAIYTTKDEQDIKTKGFEDILPLMSFFENKDHHLLTILAVIRDENGEVLYVV